MGADGHVLLYDYWAVDEEHRRRYSHGIDADWAYLANVPTGEPRGLVRVAGKVLIVRYMELGTLTERDTADDFWCGMDENAGLRVRDTLEAVGPIAECEVWT